MTRDHSLGLLPVVILIILGMVFPIAIITVPFLSSQGHGRRAALSRETIGVIPLRLKIPSINVDAVIESVGLTKDGAMDTPKDLANTAWFDLGSRPGAAGSAVIAGHFGRKNDALAAFDNLHALQNGDKIYVEDAQGATVTFVVRELRRYDPDKYAPEVFSSTDGKAHLNLITCIGSWETSKKSYSDRLVVFTDKE